MSNNAVVIVSAKRTPIGAFQGVFSTVKCPQLGAVAASAAIAAAGVSPDDIQEVIMGCVLTAGVGQAPARQAALAAGIPVRTPATTINKMCGSGLKAVMLGCDQIRARSADIILAGGMESMTNAPHMLMKARNGYRIGHADLVDHMLCDGLESPFDGKAMGYFADATARHYHFTRSEQDDFAAASVQRAMNALANGFFEAEIAPVTVTNREGQSVISVDQTPSTCKGDRIRALRPAFGTDGTVTAASSSSISDGAAALVLMRETTARERGLIPIARVLAQSTYAHEPEWFTTAPVGAIRKVLQLVDWSPDDVDLYEINEAFAVVTLAAMRELKIDHSRVNVNGGACALGHPIGASGARILTTLLHALTRKGTKRGVAALCIGGGEAVAVAVEIAL